MTGTKHVAKRKPRKTAARSKATASPASRHVADRILSEIEADKSLQLRLVTMLRHLVVYEGVRLCD
jgi:hypothetical protein